MWVLRAAVRSCTGLGPRPPALPGEGQCGRPSGLRVPSRLWRACRPHRPGPHPPRKDSRARWSCLLSNDDGPILHKQSVVCLGSESRGALASCSLAAVFILKPLQSRSAGSAGCQWFLPVAGSVCFHFHPRFFAPQNILNDIEQLRQASTGSTCTLQEAERTYPCGS